MSNRENAYAYIKATTAYGGDDYFKFSKDYTVENAIAFEKWLAKQQKVSNITLYRGYCFEESYWNDACIEKGSIIGEDQMTASLDLPAFTTSEIRAARYINDYGNGIGDDDDIRVLFKIQTNGRYFVDISEHSFYSEENECRCVRDTRLMVTNIIRKGGFYLVECIEK